MADFFAMGGYGFYVWGSYIVTAVFMIVEVLWVRNRRKTVLQRLSVMRKLSRSAPEATVQAASITAVKMNSASTTQPK